MSIYQELDIRPVINAAATLTKLGGSLMPKPVIEAMNDASGQFIDLFEFQEKAGRRIAESTRNEAAFVSSGAAAGIALTVASCIAGTDPVLQQAFPYLEGCDKREVIVYRGQRNGYDYAARQTGARLIEIEPEGDELEMNLTDRTACVLLFAGQHFADWALPLEEVIAIAHTMGVPVIVDAAAQIPPVSNLWHFTTELGADAAIFSGGKGLRGPQSSGLIVGRQEIIDGVRVNAAPNQSLGRPMKVGKEEMAGLIAALEWSLAQDEPATLAKYEDRVRFWIDGLSGIPGITAERSYPSEAGQPHGRTVVTIGPDAAVTRDAAIDALWERNPRIAVSPIGDDAIALNPQTIEDGEEQIVLSALREVLGTEAERRIGG
jgi:L-seryl-tRNA(Ser) seleniumtransferase